MGVRHSFTSAKADSADATKIQPSHWNDDHTATAAGIMYAGTDGGDIANVAAGQNYFRTLRRKFNASTNEEYEFAGTANDVESTAFDFTAQTPNVDLTAGVGASITLSPVPLGINGANFRHYVYISGGTGTAEAVLITGGTAVSGSASGTLTFTPSNNHTGAWTITSATAGIQEAVRFIEPSGRGRVKLPPSSILLYAPVNIYQNAIVIQGAGKLATYVYNTGTNNHFEFFSEDELSAGINDSQTTIPISGVCAVPAPGVVTIESEQISYTGRTATSLTGCTRGYNSTTPAAHSSGVRIGTGLGVLNELRNMSITVFPGPSTTGWGVYLRGQGTFTGQELYLSGCHNGVNVYNSSNFYLGNSEIRSFANGAVGLNIDNTATASGFAEYTIERLVMDAGNGSTATAGILLQNGGGFNFTNLTVVQCGNGIIFAPSTGKTVDWGFFTNCNFDTCTGWGIRIAPTGTGVVKGHTFVNCWAASNEEDGWVIQQPTGTTVSGITIAHSRSIYNKKHGMNIISGQYISLLGNHVAGNDYNTTNTYNGISVLTTATPINICHNTSGPSHNHADTQYFGLVFGGTDPIEAVISNNVLVGNLNTHSFGLPLNDNMGNIRCHDNLLNPNEYYGAAVAAATVDVTPGTEYLELTGTTNVSKLRPAWPGKRIMLTFSDVAPGDILDTGNFAAVYSPTQNEVMEYVYINDKWRKIS